MIKQILNSLKFSFSDFSKNLFKALFSSFGILFLIAFLVAYIATRQSIKSYLSEKIFGSMKINDIIITPGVKRGEDVLAPTASSKNIIPVWKVKRIRRMKGLKNIYSIIRLDYISILHMGMNGKYRDTHVPIYGVDPGFFRGKNRNWRKFRNITPVPVIAPKFAIKYLNAYAANYGWPQLSEDLLQGYPLEIRIRRTHKDYTDPLAIKIPAQLLSFSNTIDFVGIFLPTKFIVQFAKKHRMDSGHYIKGYKYTKIYAKVKNVKSLPAITRKIKRLGLRVNSQSDISKKMNRALKIIDSFTLSISFIILILTFLSIFNSYLVIVTNKTYQFSLQRVLGLSKIRIIISFVIESAIIGAVYGSIGYYIGIFGIDYISQNITKWIPLLKGFEIQKIDSGMFFIALLLSISISSLSALIPAIFASNKNLFKTVGR